LPAITPITEFDAKLLRTAGAPHERAELRRDSGA
jgi:hypothetical protein